MYNLYILMSTKQYTVEFYKKLMDKKSIAIKNDIQK